MAGFGAGFTESLFAVTPFESIKTQLSVAPFPIFFEHELPWLTITP